MTSSAYPEISIASKESEYRDADGKPKKFPSIDDAATKTLSVIVPAYNEEERCKFSLVCFLKFLDI